MLRVSSLHYYMDCHWPLVFLKCSLTLPELHLLQLYFWPLITPRQEKPSEIQRHGPNWPQLKVSFHSTAKLEMLAYPRMSRDINSTFLLSVIIVSYPRAFLYSVSAGASSACNVLVSNWSAKNLQQQWEIEVTAPEWTNWNRLLWNLQALADTCWSQNSMPSLLPSYASLQLP